MTYFAVAAIAAFESHGFLPFTPGFRKGFNIGEPFCLGPTPPSLREREFSDGEVALVVELR